MVAKKRGKLLASHRYNHLPLLPSGPGGVQQELVVQDLPADKSTKNNYQHKIINQNAYSGKFR